MSNRFIPSDLLDQSSDSDTAMGPSRANTPVPHLQLNSKTLCLTYPDWHGDEPDSHIHDRLWSFLKQWSPVYTLVARELHADGRPHLHAAVRCSLPCRIRSCRILDIAGNHPNIQPARKWSAWIQYCKKDGKYSERGEDPAFDKPARPGQKELVPPELIIKNAKELTKGEFLVWMSTNHLQYAPVIWDSFHKDTMITISQGEIIKGTVNPIFQKLIAQVNWIEEKCLILVGESGIGKTTYAKQIIPKPALFITHIDDLKKFEPDYHKSILFDDVCFNHYPVQSQIHLVDYENPRSIHVRYGTARIPAGVAKIFTCNEDPINLTHPAIRRRVQVVRCDVLALKDHE